MDKAWLYIQSNSEVDLDENRQILMNAMEVGEQKYMREYWLSKES
jgi:hypothetical protein